MKSSGTKNERNAKINIGIIGTGRIAGRFVPEAAHAKGVSISGVHNPNLVSAKKFADEYGLGLHTDEIGELLPNVDAVYIASPHHTHYGYIMEALENGKHVLCEKPMVLKRCDAETAFALARKKGRILMEAIKTAYCPGFSSLVKVSNNGSIGAVYDVEACFTKLSPLGSRELSVADGGSFTELGSYPVMAIFKLLGMGFRGVRFQSFYNEKGLDIYTKALFEYPSCVATAKVGLGVKSEGQLVVSGSKGYILARAPWWKTAYFELRHENPAANERFRHKYAGDGLRYVIDDFAKAVNGDSPMPMKMTDHESIVLASLMERFLRHRESERSTAHDVK